MARAIAPQDGHAAVAAWRSGSADMRQLRTAVRYTLQLLARDHPGSSVEVRVPPAGAVQAVPGPRHTRGTPPSVVETDPETWLGLATGSLTWAQAQQNNAIRASGLRSDLGALLPLQID